MYAAVREGRMHLFLGRRSVLSLGEASSTSLVHKCRCNCRLWEETGDVQLPLL